MLTRRMRALAAVMMPALAVGLVATLGATPALAVQTPARAVQQSGDILDQLKAVPGLTVLSEEPPPAPEYRFFLLSFRQPIDHRHPSAGTFEQRFQLLHKSTDRPMVLHTTGYDMPEYSFRAEPTKLLDGNQISVEERFFTPSRPQPADWGKLDIWQAATDHHTIVEALKPIYTAKWVSTGASKGGMTSVYHRRFYPGDVAGVVAYVAPNDPINVEDRAYDRFFQTVGDATCRRDLENLQKQALTRRVELVAKYQAFADLNGYTFTTLGSADRAFEMTVLDTVWGFWQYHSRADCATVPATTASSQEIFDFINGIADFSFYTDQGLAPYTPYYYQAATQLGWPSLRFEHLRGLAAYPNLYQANSSLPAELRSRHQVLPMLDVDFWVRTQSSQMLFVYGSDDPWGAEPFHPSRHDSFSFTAPGANHGANLAALPAADRDTATAALLRWAGVDATKVTLASAVIPGLDQRDPRTERRPL